MRIHLDRWYNRAGGPELPPGDHDVDDELGMYLVDIGKAVALPDLPPAPVKAPPPANKKKRKPPANKKKVAK